MSKKVKASTKGRMVGREIPLMREDARYIYKKVRSGEYEFAGDVLVAALQLLRDRDAAEAARRARFHAKIRAGLNDIRAGRTRPLDKKVVKEICERGRRRLKLNRYPRVRVV